MRCQSCQSLLEPADRFCPDCGAPASVQPPAPSAPGPGPATGPSRPTRGRLWMLALGGAVLIAVLVAVLAVDWGTEVKVDSQYVVITETWDGSTLQRRLTTAEIVTMEKGKYTFRLGGQMQDSPSQPTLVTLTSARPEVTVTNEKAAPVGEASPYHHLAKALVAMEPSSAGDSATVPAQVPAGKKLERLGDLDLVFARDTARHSGKTWERVIVSARPVSLKSRLGGEKVLTTLAGAFIWDKGCTKLAVAELWVSQKRGDILVWSRLSIHLADAEGTGKALLGDIRRRIPAPRASDGSSPGSDAMAELAWINRSAAMTAAVYAEGAHNPAFLAILGLAHLADAAYTFGANMGHDLGRMVHDDKHRFNPFDGDVESPLNKYVYRNISKGGASLASVMGLIGVEDVEGWSIWGGDLLHFVGGVAGSTAVSHLVRGMTVGKTMRQAHRLWGMAAKATGAKKRALVELGRLAFYGAKLYRRTKEVAEPILLARTSWKLWKDRPWETPDENIMEPDMTPPCSNECPKKKRRSCSGRTAYRVCGNFDSDPCLEWGKPKRCRSLHRCVNGVCAHVGDPRFTLTWNNSSDLDLHVITPCRLPIFYRNRRACGGRLDVDDRCKKHHGSPGGPENIYWRPGTAPSGLYVVVLRYFSTCGRSRSTRYKLRIRHDGRYVTRRGVLSSPGGGKGPFVEVYRFTR